jgi:hypothetical protein
MEKKFGAKIGKKRQKQQKKGRGTTPTCQNKSPR